MPKERLVNPESREVLRSKLRGVPDWIFQNPPQEGWFIGNSGRSRLKYDIDLNNIRIEGEPGTSSFVFSAFRETSGFIHFSIRTERNEGGKIVKHPDLYARDLAIRAEKFFEDHHGPSQGAKLTWPNNPNWDTNLKQFEEAYTREKNFEKALFSTWSGKLFYDLGFRKIEHYNYSGRDLQARLGKTNQVDIQISPAFQPPHIAILNLFIRHGKFPKKG